MMRRTLLRIDPVVRFGCARDKLIRTCYHVVHMSAASKQPSGDSAAESKA
jgi:hypothetical protein